VGLGQGSSQVSSEKYPDAAAADFSVSQATDVEDLDCERWQKRTFPGPNTDTKSITA